MKNKLYILSFACFININAMHQEENTANAANAQHQTASSEIDSNQAEIAALNELSRANQKFLEASERLNRLTRSKENSQQTKDEFLVLESMFLSLKDSYSILNKGLKLQQDLAFLQKQIEVLQSLEKLYEHRIFLPKESNDLNKEELKDLNKKYNLSFFERLEKQKTPRPDNWHVAKRQVMT